MNLRIREATDADEPLLVRVDDGLGLFNDNAAPLHQVRSLACVAEDEDDGLLGGVRGRTWGQCAEIQQLWVDDAQRNQAIGSRLMQAFEAAAQLRGVRTFYLDTWSFQARGFYEKLGYRVALEIEGMGDGPARFSKYIMLKTVAPD